MKFLSRFSPRVPKRRSTAGPITEWPTDDFRGDVAFVTFDADNRHTVNVVGEGAYQGTLERIGGGRTINGCRKRDHTVVLLPEPTNRYDSNAVRVAAIPFGGSAASGLVGYLSREDAVAYRPRIDRLASVGRLVACAATLQGGWDRGGGDRGHIGVRLHIDSPAGALLELERDPDAMRPPWENPE